VLRRRDHPPVAYADVFYCVITESKLNRYLVCVLTAQTAIGAVFKSQRVVGFSYGGPPSM
jgi:hypothetical protein